MKKIGAVIGAIIATLFFVMLVQAGAMDRATNCLRSPVNLAGNPTGISPLPSVAGSAPLFEKFQSAPTFSEADRIEQRKNAATIVSIGSARPEKLSDRDIAIAVKTAIQESNMRNLPHQGAKNDHDSVGMYQQRPSAFYGTASEIMNLNRQINKFYDRLVQVPNRDKMTDIEVAIKIQIPSRSAYYSRWAWDGLGEEIVALYKGTAPTQEAEFVCPPPETVVAAGVTGSGGHLPVDEGYSITSPFDDPRYSGAPKPHKGTDFAFGGGGQPVYAARSGVVISSGIGQGCVKNGSNNNTVTIVHDDGTLTGYLHMPGNGITVKKGDRVQAGQQIGVIGTCGQSSGPHLHFEVSPAQNKEPWVQNIKHVTKYGQEWLDPVAYMAHFGVAIK